jgi:hypothetical protein
MEHLKGQKMITRTGAANKAYITWQTRIDNEISLRDARRKTETRPTNEDSPSRPSPLYSVILDLDCVDTLLTSSSYKPKTIANRPE